MPRPSMIALLPRIRRAALAGLVAAAALMPGLAQETPPRVLVRVDPRVELLSLVFRLAGNPEYGQAAETAWLEAALARAAPHREHPAVRLAARLREERGVGYDAVMSLAIHLKDARLLEPAVPLDPWPEGLDARWTRERVEAFLAEARRFAEAIGFAGLLTAQAPILDETAARAQALVDARLRTAWFERFFGTRPGAHFVLVPGLLNGGHCYGPRVRGADGAEELYCILGVWLTDESRRPRFDESVLPVVAHEFCHSFVNPLADRHERRFEAALPPLFAGVESTMRRQAYAAWPTMLRESLVRAAVARYVLATEGEAPAARQVRAEERRGFAWTGALAALLGRYEAERDRCPTFESFLPEVAAFFEGYAAADARARRPNPTVLASAPADGARDVDPATDRLVVTFDRPMKDGSWSVVGGGPRFPKIEAGAGFDAARRVFSVPWRLEPGHDYELWLNSENHEGFRSAEGAVLEPVRIAFRTGNAR